MSSAPEVSMPQAAPVGYGALVARHSLVVVRPNRWTFLAKQGGGRSEERQVALRLPHLDPEAMTDTDHLLFALKHEGVFLPVLDAYIERLPRERLEEDLCACIRARPNSRYARILWFLYEWLTGTRLPLADLEVANYVPVLEPARYFTGPSRVACGVNAFSTTCSEVGPSARSFVAPTSSADGRRTRCARR
jgi:hypothetical protein